MLYLELGSRRRSGGLG